MRAQQRYSLLFIICIFNLPVWSDQLYDASLLEKDGNVEKAIQLYDSWLSENQSDPGFSDILFYCTSIITSIENSLDFLLKYEDFISNDNRQEYYYRLAQLYGLNFQKEEAALYYGKASVNLDGNLNYEIYLKQLYLNYEMGVIPELTDLNNILLSHISPATYVEALVLKSEILKYNGDFLRAEMILLESEYKSLYPQISLALWDIYILQNKDLAISNLFKYMKEKFPDSIEFAIMIGEIKRLPRLSDLFIQSELYEYKSYVQVGTYSSRENIKIQSDKLKSYGFNFIYSTENNLTKIIVVDNIPSEQLLNRLKSIGIDGFIINYP